jgi:hypothetical protein
VAPGGASRQCCDNNGHVCVAGETAESDEVVEGSEIVGALSIEMIPKDEANEKRRKTVS